MVSLELSEGISETLDILSHMDQSYTQKIPKKLMDFFEKNKSHNYNSNLDHSKKLNDLNLRERTKNILAILYINYWSNSEQKIIYNRLLNENEKKRQAILRKKYNPNNIFHN